MAKTAPATAPQLSETGRAQFRDNIQQRLRQIMDEESKSHDQAFIDLALESLEFATDSGEITDGPRDSGIDYYELTDTSATIAQLKSQDISDGIDWDRKFDTNALDDLRRVKEVLLDLAHPPEKASRAVQNFLIKLADAIIQHRQLSTGLGIGDEDDGQASFTIDIHLICLGSSLTDAAWDEFQKIQNTDHVMFEGVKVYLNYWPKFADEIIRAKWRQQSSGWITINGAKQERVGLRCVDSHTDLIQTAKSCTFFTKAFDLVKAYRDLGYQIFEPNVRCELTSSPINKEIRQSLGHSRGRKQFRDLNNGVTITCSSFQKPTQNNPVVGLTRPGIINGLQTVKSLHDAYYGLKDPKDRADFEAVTEVLVRVHTATQLEELTQLIRATNNQNPMKPRNLRSNEAEQITFQENFGNLNWFYARKEREWEAFRDAPAAWAKRLQNKRHTHFQTTGKPTRRVDNLDVAQAYFSFIGFTTEAMNKTKSLFDDNDIYAIIFKLRIAQHGADYGRTFATGRQEIIRNASARPPSAEVLLLSFLCREAAKVLSPDQRQLRDDSIARLKLEKATPEERNRRLKGDADYAIQYILRGTVFIFVEVVGHLMFRAFGDLAFDAARGFLANASMAEYAKTYDPEVLVQAHKTYRDEDVLMMLWDLYEDVIRSLVYDTTWFSQWQIEPNLSRFHYSVDTRRRIFDRIGELEKMVTRHPLDKPWSAGPDKAGGITKYLQKLLTNHKFGA